MKGETAMAEMIEYMGGLPVGKPEERLKEVAVKRSVLHFKGITPGRLRNKHWEYDLPLDDIAATDVYSEKALSKNRAFMLGLGTALLWKRKDYFLSISANIGGMSTTILLHGKREKLEEIRQAILKARAEAAAIR
jgi:hypothetical protein